ncbi:MAG TPA: ribonuclease III [Anaeromyxobacter sp.]|nr:ribonuclease III [Anaeromyxobacter sp.]
MTDERGSLAAGARDPVAELEERLGLRFADRATAIAALTHKSYVNEHRDQAGLLDNERLEFLGDAVIDLAVSHRLMERFPEAREGELSKMRAAVVDELGLCEMARALDLGALLRLGRGEELTGGRQKSSLLADAMEAVIAAVFLEAGLGPVLQIADRFLGDAFARATAGTLDRDFKTQLQELAQSRLRSTPRYRVVAERGPDHSKTFEVETELRGEVLGRGAGRSKKDAEQAAAKLALEALARRVADAAPPPPGPVPAPEEPAPHRMAVEAAVVPLPAPEPPPVPAPPERETTPELPVEPSSAKTEGPPPRKTPARRPAARKGVRAKVSRAAPSRTKIARKPARKGTKKR